MTTENNSRRVYILLSMISVLVPLIVAILLFSSSKTSIRFSWVYMLPHLNGVINSLTSLLLVIGFIFIRAGRIRAHRLVMTSAFIMGVMFLLSYVVYHASVPSAVFGDQNQDGVLNVSESESVGRLRLVYLSVLLSHIVLAVVVVPFVLFAFYFAWSGKIPLHKKTVRFALPLWLYVSVTGVLIYMMIRPYY